MSIAHTEGEMHSIIAKLFVQTGNEGLGFAGTDMPATIAPHPPVVNSYQVTPKNDLSFVNRNAHAPSLYGTPAPIMLVRVIT